MPKWRDFLKTYWTLLKRKQYNKSVNITDNKFIEWCKDNRIEIYKILHVITWEEWDDGMGVYIFVKSNIELENIKTMKDELVDKYHRLLDQYNYPFDKFPNIVYEFDSDQNVQENYAGSYFYRLR